MNLFGFMKIKVVAACISACALMAAGCQKAPVMPVEISSEDECYFCKSKITDPAFAAEFLTNSGSVRKFDDMACLIASAKEIGKENIQSFYVMDNISVTLIPAEHAQFVRSDKIQTPKNEGLVAFKNPSEAQSLAARYHAELVTFNDLVK